MESKIAATCHALLIIADVELWRRDEEALLATRLSAIYSLLISAAELVLSGQVQLKERRLRVQLHAWDLIHHRRLLAVGQVGVFMFLSVRNSVDG